MREVILDGSSSAGVTLSTIRATAHLGAHADAPSHLGGEAPSIDEIPLDPFLGPCHVVRVAASRGAILGPEAVRIPPRVPRVLFATGTYPDPDAFNEDFAGLSAELVEVLARRGVKLVGIDTPGVDPYSSRDLPAHRACFRHGIAVLEGLALADVPEGIFELIALPLRLVGFEASPVRAVLRGPLDLDGAEREWR